MPNSELHKRFCKNARRIREEQEMTQQEVAERLKVSRPYVAELEAGRHAPSLDLVERIAKALKVPATDLLEIPEKVA